MVVTSPDASYQPQRYWDDLLGDKLDERGVAYPSLPLSFNQAFYKAEIAATKCLLADHEVGALGKGRVLDIGSGTGIWIDFWRGLGASDITGVDLTEASVVSLRQRYPEHEFHLADIGAARQSALEKYDLVSAMSVLLHITDDVRWRRAWANIADLLVPGGYAVFVEPVLIHEWQGRPFDNESNSKARPLNDYLQAIADAGLEVVDIRPATVLLANPVDARSLPAYRLMWLVWAVLERLIRGSENRGRLVGTLLGAADVPLRRLLPRGPTAKLVLTRRRP